MNYDDLLLHCDSLIKAGKINLVAEQIRTLVFSQVPRKYRQALGKVCRRSGLIELGLRLLYPIIRNERPLEVPATAGEICEYAVLLSRNGSTHEALVLLELVDSTVAPEALLYQGFCHVSNWNYLQAASDFEQFLDSQADDYSKLIARVNLVAAYIANEQFGEAEQLLLETVAIAQSQNATRLIGNCCELRAQVAFFRKDFPLAKRELSQALAVFAESGSYDQLLIQKWHSAMAALETRSEEPLLKFCEEALKRRHWESVRDTDFYRLKIRFDQRGFDHLIFGTPAPSYGHRAQKELLQAPSDFYVLGRESARILDLQTGDLPAADDISGTKIHQMISALLKDFYAPSNIGSLFSEIYRDEYFNINSSPTKVRQVLRRTRRWLEANSVPGCIAESGGSYKFILTGEFGVRIPHRRMAVDGLNSQWQKVIKAFASSAAFTAEEVCEKLRMSRTSFHRLSLWAMDHQLVTKSGNNKSTTYSFVPAGQTKVA